MALIVTTPDSDTLGATNTAPHFVPEIWTDDVDEAAQFAEVIIQRCSRSKERSLTKGDVAHTPMLSNIGTYNLPTDDTTDITAEAPREDRNKLVIDQQKYAAVRVGSLVKVQARQDLMGLYTRKLGYAISRGKETFMSGKFDTPTANVVGTLGVPLTADDYLDVWQKLQEAGVVADQDPSEEFSLILSPAAYADALKVDVFANRQYNPKGNAIQRASVGDIYGFGTFLSNLLESDATGQRDMAAFHRDAYAFVDQQSPVVEHDRIVNRLHDVVVAWSVYGGMLVKFPPEAAPGSATYTTTDNRAVYIKGK